MLLANLYDNIRFWEAEGEEAIRTHPSFLARWNTKRKLLKGGAGGMVGCYTVPGAQPVTALSGVGAKGERFFDAVRKTNASPP